ncbi:MAG: hypothetical protein Q8N54_04630 [Sulfurimicrobium sp.]|jgi:hypothetical protein|nr:hypothetical protein [Sulfurimicrobium sp.]MDO9189287.1 hypothetical protein [Sulfurimicrobium sp.]MDP2197344.1 hypothetical protein [Sulfurimicrobium sp.]MDP2962022.1 hypothetical protein [Sulfurimicrobium sp.]MDP3688430.1 hypothetical protein [Sulfurimicrobium sp.]
MSKLEDKLTASIKPANQRKAPATKTTPMAKPASTEPAVAPVVAKPEPAAKNTPAAASKPKSKSSDAPYIKPAKRVWPD